MTPSDAAESWRGPGRVDKKSSRAGSRTSNPLLVTTALIGPDGTIKMINGAWRRFAMENGLDDLSGASPGVNYLEVCRRAAEGGDESAREALDGIRAVLRGEIEEYYQKYPCHSPEKKRWYLMKVAPLGEGGEVLIEHIDITQLRLAEDELRESEERYRTLYEDNPSMYFTVDSSGTVLSVNSFGASQLGYSPEELVGRHISTVFHPADREAVQRQLALCLDNPHKLATWEFRKVRRDGSIFWVREAARAIPKDDGEEVILVVCEDVTYRKLAEEELRGYAAKLERSNRELEEFAFVATHDLQEPLRKIQLFSTLLQARGNTLSEGQHLDLLQRMQKTAGWMQHLINSFMDYAKVAVAPKRFKKVSLKGLVEAAVDDLKEKIEESDARVNVGELHLIDADSYQMKRLFFHLIDNALKYRSEKEPLISIHGEVKEDRCIIYVSDNGVGFDERYLDLIFRPFQRLSGRDEFAGTGMGLSICRKIVEHHGGTITAESKPGKGSTFIISLPLKECSEVKTGAEHDLQSKVDQDGRPGSHPYDDS